MQNSEKKNFFAITYSTKSLSNSNAATAQGRNGQRFLIGWRTTVFRFSGATRLASLR